MLRRRVLRCKAGLRRSSGGDGGNGRTGWTVWRMRGNEEFEVEDGRQLEVAARRKEKGRWVEGPGALARGGCEGKAGGGERR